MRPGEHYWIAAPEPYFLDTLNRVAPGDADDESVREIRRFWMAGVKELHIDPQGRITLSSIIEGKPGDQYVFAGTGQDFEIWHQLQWDKKYPEDRGKNGSA